MAEPRSYVADDLYRESSEGRYLHDDAYVFYRTVMGLTTPIKSLEQPSVLQIETAIKTKVSKDNLLIWTIINSLQLTSEQELWPGTGAIMTPENSVRKLWSASKSFSDAALRYHHAENIHLQKRKVITPDKITTCPSTSKESQVESATSTPQKKSKLSSPRKKKASGKPGKRSGTKNWTATEINLLLDSIDEIMPSGREMWEQVAVSCLEVDESWGRAGESCKHKFEKMAFAKQPTGQADIPLHILRAKKIKDKISHNEVLGCVYQNEVGTNDDDEELTCELLSSASLLSENKGVRRPVTKKQRGKEVGDAIAQAGTDNLEGAKQLASALNKMAEAMKSPTPSGMILQSQESHETQSELDANKIIEFDLMKDDIANIKDTMNEILSHLKNK